MRLQDIKPENVVVTGDGVTKLCDFGLAIDTKTDTPTSRVGTAEFMVRRTRRSPSCVASLPHKHGRHIICSPTAALLVPLTPACCPFRSTLQAPEVVILGRPGAGPKRCSQGLRADASAAYGEKGQKRSSTA